MSSHDRSDAAEAESSSSHIEGAKLQVEQTINPQSADTSKSTSSATSTVKSAQRALRVRKECHRSNHTDESDVANDDRHDLESEEKYDPADKLLDSIVDLSLFDPRTDVTGGHVFGFHTPKKRDSMVTLAQESAERTPKRLVGHTPSTLTAGAGGIPKTPKSPTGAKPKTPKSSVGTATPMHASNDEIKKKGMLSLGDCSANNKASKANPGKNTDLVHCTDPLPTPEFVLISDKTTNSEKKPEIPRNEQDKIDQLLAERSQPNPHTFNIKEMLTKYEQEFPLWLVILHQGFNLMLHGMGSKRVLLDSFYRKHMMKKNAVVLQGFSPELSVKDVLDAIANYLHLMLPTANTHKAIDAIENKLRRTPNIHLFLLVHNMDGEPMRNELMQMVLCRLATIPNVHIVATIDSISLPSMWTTSQVDLFNFSWRKVITMLPDATETSF
uniref:Origin recognition complex subunit 2 n=1 Tax=Anopheles atroparvus TaxID=41427 RepID=A0AAG5DML2_ANOAO